MSVVNVAQWQTDNAESFAPPVCNKLMHGDGMLKVMFVSGPNQRKDYHLNQGEELFYQLKGDMVLRIREGGDGPESVSRDVRIREGEVFLLPGGVPHSPQRFENTFGLVLERARPPTELDGLRYYVDDEVKGSPVLWQKFFHCTDLGTQLPPVIREYMASPEHADRIPRDNVPAVPFPLTLGVPQEPFALAGWLESHAAELASNKAVDLFDRGGFQIKVAQSDVVDTVVPSGWEAWVWVLHGAYVVTDGAGSNYPLKDGDSVLVGNGVAALSSEKQGVVLIMSHPPVEGI